MAPSGSPPPPDESENDRSALGGTYGGGTGTGGFGEANGRRAKAKPGQRMAVYFSSIPSRDRNGSDQFRDDNNGLFDLRTIQSSKALESPGQGIEDRSARTAMGVDVAELSPDTIERGRRLHQVGPT